MDVSKRQRTQALEIYDIRNVLAEIFVKIPSRLVVFFQQTL